MTTEYRFAQSLPTPKVWQELADSLMPDPIRSAEDLQRQRHADLPELSDFQIWQEIRRLEDVLAWVQRPAEWLKDRYKRLLDEQKGRKKR